jgi:UDP-2,3-diacylglucosamine pyrophosphatase LpxH
MLLLIKKLPKSLRDRYRDYLDKPWDQRVKEGFELDDDEKRQIADICETYREDLPLVRKHLHQITEGTFAIASTIPNVSPRDYLVEGHTHEAKGLQTTAHYKNLGCWYKKQPHYCLTIDRIGNCRVFRWATRVEMEQEGLDRRCQPA